MKTSKAITLAMVALALCATPALAQRNGGGSRGGGSHSSSMGSSRSSGSSFSSSSSRSGSSFSSPSRSTSSSSRSSMSAPSRSESSRSVSTPAPASSRSSASFRNSGATPRVGAAPRSEGMRQPPAVRGARQAGTTDHRRGMPADVRRSNSGDVRGGSPADMRRGAPSDARRSNPGNDNRLGTPANSGRPGTPGSMRESARRPGASASGPRTSSGRANDVTPFARPGRPGGAMPPSSRPIHPAPYFHHPWHGGYVHCHPIFWDPLPPRPWYWPGFWHYCNSYWYDYHVTDVVVVHDYVQSKYNVDLVTYGISGDIMYAIVRDGGTTYLQVYDKDDHLLAEQKINRKYCNMVIDSENGGCWISKKNEKDPLLFIWADGQLLIYEAD